ncbi:transmembrane protein 192 isoform 1-T1 [Mantella aurantiaca]
MERGRRILLDSSGELTQSADDEDCLLDAPISSHYKIEAEIRPIFHPVPTVWLSIILLLLQVTFVSLAVVAGYFCLLHGERDKCNPYTKPLDLNTIVIICKVVLWLLHVLNERFLQHHHFKAKSRGYLKLYRTTSHLETVPLITNSTGNAAVLLIISAQDFFKDDIIYLYLIWSVLILELILSAVFLLIYIVFIYKFNRSRAEADIIEEERIHAFQKYAKPGIGFRSNSELEEVVAKQGDTIEYLKRHNEAVCRELLEALAQNRKEQQLTSVQ